MTTKKELIEFVKHYNSVHYDDKIKNYSKMSRDDLAILMKKKGYNVVNRGSTKSVRVKPRASTTSVKRRSSRSPRRSKSPKKYKRTSPKRYLKSVDPSIISIFRGKDCDIDIKDKDRKKIWKALYKDPKFLLGFKEEDLASYQEIDTVSGWSVYLLYLALKLNDIIDPNIKIYHKEHMKFVKPKQEIRRMKMEDILKDGLDDLTRCIAYSLQVKAQNEQSQKYSEYVAYILYNIRINPVLLYGYTISMNHLKVSDIEPNKEYMVFIIGSEVGKKFKSEMDDFAYFTPNGELLERGLKQDYEFYHVNWLKNKGTKGPYPKDVGRESQDTMFYIEGLLRYAYHDDYNEHGGFQVCSHPLNHISNNCLSNAKICVPINPFNF